MASREPDRQFPTDSQLLALSNGIGAEKLQLATCLGISVPEVERIEANNAEELQSYAILKRWCDQSKVNSEQRCSQLKHCFTECGKGKLAEIVQQYYVESRRKSLTSSEASFVTFDGLPDMQSKKEWLTITGQGGHCLLPETAAALYVPPSAISTTTDIAIVQYQADDSASGVYEFLPHGLEFDEFVTVKFPLTLKDTYDVGGLDVLYSNTDEHEAEIWESLSKNPQFAWCILEDFCYLHMKRFCKMRVCIVGSGSWTLFRNIFCCQCDSKISLNVTVFGHYDRRNKHAQVSVVYCCNENKYDYGLMKNALPNRKMKKSQTVPLLVYKNKGNINMTIIPEEMSKWNIADQQTQSITTELLFEMCRLGSALPVNTFSLYLNEDQIHHCLLRVKVEQPNGPELPITLTWTLNDEDVDDYAREVSNETRRIPNVESRLRQLVEKAIDSLPQNDILIRFQISIKEGNHYNCKHLKDVLYMKVLEEIKSSQGNKRCCEEMKKIFQANGYVDEKGELEKLIDEQPINGFPNDAGLHDLANKIGHKIDRIAAELGIDHTEVERIRENHKGNAELLNFKILVSWRDNSTLDAKDRSVQLQRCMNNVGEQALVQMVEKCYQKYFKISLASTLLSREIPGITS